MGRERNGTQLPYRCVWKGGLEAGVTATHTRLRLPGISILSASDDGFFREPLEG
jgi:hypothetical protein